MYFVTPFDQTINLNRYTRQVMQETLRISSVSTFAARISPDHEVRIEVTCSSPIDIERLFFKAKKRKIYQRL